MTQNQIESLERGVQYVQLQFDGRSLDHEIAVVIEKFKKHAASGGRAARTRAHPMIEALARLKYGKELSGGRTRPSADLVRLGRLGQQIELLKSNSVPGFQERLARLWCDDWESFASTAFEIEIAELHLLYGHSVRFLPERETPVPDLLVDESIEVECKSLRQLTQRDESNREGWNQLIRKIFVRTSGQRGWYVELETMERVTHQDQEWVLSHLERAQRSGHEQIVRDERRRLRIVELSPFPVEDRLNVSLPPGAEVEKFDVSKIEITGVVQDGGISAHSSYAFMFRTTTRPDWETRMRRAIKKARNQFSGRCPAMVFVEVPVMTEETKLATKERVAHAIRDSIRQTRTLSAVVACFTHRKPIADGEAIVRSYEFERNLIASHPVPTPEEYFKRPDVVT